MKRLGTLLFTSTAFIWTGCAGDNHVTRQSAPQPTRYAPTMSAGAEINRPARQPGKFSPGRVYLVTRLQTADQPRGEWRALGETINQSGSTIEFTEMGSGKTVAFTAPHQITPTNAKSDRAVTQFNSEVGNQPPAQAVP